MNQAILKAVAQFTEFKSDKNYKLSALVKLCEDHAATLRYRNPDVCEGEFYELFWCFTPEQLADISNCVKTYNDFNV